VGVEFKREQLTRCYSPGRFFVAHELKMAIAYMLINYDIAPLKEEPIRQTLGNFVLPPFKAKMEVRKRSESEVV
jgi:hypothetical protein